MNRNIEFKAHVPDLAAVEARAAALADRGPERLEQVDTFFRVPRGRLKLREFATGTAELIYYERSDRAAARESRYWRVPCPEPRALAELLEAAHGLRAVVRKRRCVYWIGPTRVHLDRVAELGEFVELEVVLTPEQPLAAGEELAHGLMAELGIEAHSLCEVAYVDLLERNAQSDPSRASQ